MPQEIKPLCLSFRTPPVVRPQSILIGKMIRQWQHQDLQPAIINYDSNGHWDIGLPITSIPQFSPSRHINNRYINKVFPIKYFFEDIYFQRIFKRALRVIQDYLPNVIFSFSNPYASNILGAMLSKKLGIPFISHFSDPWYDDPYQTFTSLEKKMILKREKFIIQHSHKVIFCNPVAKNLIMKKYPANWLAKAEVIPHCFDPSDYPATVEKDKDKFVISHIGAFYQERNPQPLFAAVHQVLSTHPELSTKLRLNLIGGAGNYTGYKLDDLKKIIHTYNLTRIAQIIPPISYEESLRYMKLSDCLVVIDANYENSPFFTSKVVDYAGSGSNIIGITPANSPTVEFLAKLGHKSFNYDQVDELANYLTKLITGETKPQVDQKYLEEFNVANTTKKLIRLFNQVLTKT